MPKNFAADSLMVAFYHGFFAIWVFLCAVTNTQTCSFTTDPAQYNAYSSLLRMPYGSLDDYENHEIGFKGGVGGVNESGTIFLLGGAYKYEDYPANVMKWTLAVNVFDSWISYDEGATEWDTTVQNDWTWPGQQMPNIATPNRKGKFYYDSIYNYATDTKGGFYCFHPCYTQLNDIIYVIAPTITSNTLGVSQQWPVMMQYDMSGSNPHWINESTFQRDLPNNYWDNRDNKTGEYDTISLHDIGCVTNNDTHIFFFTGADSMISTSNTLMAYNTLKDEWKLLAPNPWGRWHSACTADVTGRYIYQFAGSPLYSTYGTNLLQTDKYDTWNDLWIRLGELANWPETLFGRMYSRAITDSTTNQVLIFGGSSYDYSNPNHVKFVSVKKVEIFYLNNDTFKTYEDKTDELYLLSSIQNKVHVKVDDFAPGGTQTNKRADTIFLFGGGQLSSYAKNDAESIQFISILSDRETYPNNAVIIQGEDPEQSVIESATFDAFQRFELKFRIVITDEYPYILDNTWDITFAIDGINIDSINEKYKDSNIQLLTRPLEVFGKGECEKMPNNVMQVIIAQLMIPSRRTLHNGYCPNVTETWIFAPGTISNISLIATNGTHTHSQDFSFEFSQLELVDRNRWINNIGANFFRSGCFFTVNSTNPFSRFEVRCGGYDFPGGAEFDGLNRDRVTMYTKAEIEFNVLINDVLLAPDAYVRQDIVNDSIIGTTTFAGETLIGLVRGRTKIGTWYTECVEINGTEHWLSLDETLNAFITNITFDDLWDNLLINLESLNNEDVVAAFTILQEIIESDSVPDDEDVVGIITDAVMKIINDTDLNNTNIDTIISQVALIDLLTSDPLIVIDPLIATNISQQWLPDILLKTVELLNESDSATLADTVQTIGGIANNVAMNVIKIVNNSNSSTYTTQDIIESLQELTKIQLTGTWINETVIHIREGVTTYGIKTKEEQCSFGDVSIKIPSNILHNIDLTMCIITTTEENNNNAVDLFDGFGTQIFETNDTCFPFLISMNSGSDNIFQDALDGNWLNTSGLIFPKCEFYNTEFKNWDGTGCVVYAFDEDTVTCACSHLTTFSISVEDFDPKAQLLEPDDFRILSTRNIKSHPTTWVTMLLIAVVLIITCICVPNNN
eukprot:305433_1